MALSDDFRRRAQETAAASADMMQSPDFDEKPKQQALAIIGQVNATMYSALAEALDELATLQRQGRITEQRLGILRRNDAIRRAAAEGEWDEFDRLAAGGDPTPGGNGTDQGDVE